MNGIELNKKLPMKFITRLLIVFTIIFQIQSVTGQTVDLKTLYESRSEIYFRVKFNSVKELAEIDKLVYVDKIENQHCIAYASKIQFSALINTGYQAELLVPPSMQTTDLKMTSNVLRETFEWDSYPTYSAYVDMMNSFQTDYPALCSIHSIATLQSGHQLLVAQINNGTSAGKPQFLYSSTIHGDETTGYILTLRMIDYLLSNYGINDEVTNIVDNVDIWICPLANPDGTYYFNDNTVNGATRGNANGVDLNRNYPDPEDGAHPDGNFYQPETVAFMNLANEHNFTMAANYHGGAEVLNYPWDTWVRRHADDDWWIFVSREYADTVHAYSQSGYMTDLNNGITNGYDWYSISGGRQDYMNYFKHCREVTIEVSSAKILPANQLQAHWNYNYRSMLNYMEESVFGFTGTVIDSVTRQPIIARVELLEHDVDSSLVYSSLPLGDYHRPVKNGTYDLVFSATGYSPKTISNVQIDNYQIISNNIELVPGSIIADFEANATTINRDGIIDFFDRSFGLNIVNWNWYFEGAVPSTSTIQNPTGITYPEVGDFNVQLTITNSDGQTDVILIEDYIHVNLNFLMQNGTYTTCEGLFFDSGGQNSNYSDNQNLLLSFIPDSAEHLMSLQFTSFDVEPEANCDYDWMKIYDGLSTDSQLIGEWCGSDSPGLVKATNVDGVLTISFHSDESGNGTGWSAVVSCIPTVSVNELTAEVIRIYPNPISDENATIESVDPIDQVTLIDVQGKTIIEEKLGGVKMHSIKTGNLVPGIYFLRIVTSRSTMVKQLVIL
jgi:hypothetical protein